jgi:hypothetical protein
VDSTIYPTKLIRRDTSAYSPKYSRQRHHRFMAAPCAEPWTVENTRDRMDKTPTSTHDLSVWSSSSLGRWHPRSSFLLELTRHSSPILNERWTRVINLSMFFLLCYDLTTILRSRALHRVLSSAIQYAWRSYMLSRLYRKVKTFRSDLLTYLQRPQRGGYASTKWPSTYLLGKPIPRSTCPLGLTLKGTWPTTGRIQPQRVTTGISSGNSRVYRSVNKSWLG